MNKTKCCGVFVIAVLAGIAGVILAQSKQTQDFIEVRKTKESVVLYTIHRGSFDKVGPAIGETIAAAAHKGVYPKGAIYFAYLNNPAMVSNEHWLTEIRIPVSDDALKLAGTLGQFTDVKRLPSMEMAVVIKPEGMATPEPVYQKLHAWMLQNGYMPTERPSEIFLTNGQSGDYSKIRSEILVPVTRVAESK